MTGFANDGNASAIRQVYVKFRTRRRRLTTRWCALKAVVCLSVKVRSWQLSGGYVAFGLSSSRRQTSSASGWPDVLKRRNLLRKGSNREPSYSAIAKAMEAVKRLKVQPW